MDYKRWLVPIRRYLDTDFENFHRRPPIDTHWFPCRDCATLRDSQFSGHSIQFLHVDNPSCRCLSRPNRCRTQHGEGAGLRQIDRTCSCICRDRLLSDWTVPPALVHSPSVTYLCTIAGGKTFQNLFRKDCPPARDVDRNWKVFMNSHFPKENEMYFFMVLWYTVDLLVFHFTYGLHDQMRVVTTYIAKK